MRKLTATLLISMGVFASGSGVIQVSAALYTFSVDFETKTVANFDDYTQTYSQLTYGLDASITYNFSGTYAFNTCPYPLTVDVNYEGYWRLNAAGAFLDYQLVALPDFVCTTTPTTYSVEITTSVSDQFIAAVINDDANYAQIRAVMLWIHGGIPGLEIRLFNYTTYLTLNYEFNTTYLFNYFLSDTQYTTDFRQGTWTLNSDAYTNLNYVYTTAGNDEYRLVNTNVGGMGTSRKKYAINYNDEYFRGNSIGARIRRAYITDAPYSYDRLSLGASGTSILGNFYSYYYLNSSNFEQDISNVPEFEYEYEDCGWNVFDIPCFINNGIAYVVNDAPVVSDAFTLLNAGMKLGGQAFSVIGQFSDNNLFGVLILGGLGITAVRWFLKND